MASSISEQDRKVCLEKALKAADWFVNSRYQGDHRFDANNGRCLYYHFMPERRSLPGINWSHGRAMFVLAEAYKISGDDKYLEAARGCGRFVRALQQLDPARPVSYGVFAEESPTCGFAGMLDGAQAASGLLMLHEVSGDEGCLRGGRAFCDFLVRNWREGAALPGQVRFDPDNVHSSAAVVTKCMHHCTAIPLWHLHRITGEACYVPPLLDAADRILKCQRPEGPFNFVEDTDGVELPAPNHHEGYGDGDERYILRNDDGIVTVVTAGTSTRWSGTPTGSRRRRRCRCGLSWPSRCRRTTSGTSGRWPAGITAGGSGGIWNRGASPCRWRARATRGRTGASAARTRRATPASTAGRGRTTS